MLYTLVALRPSKVTWYDRDADYDQEELLVETGLSLEQLEELVEKLGCEDDSRYPRYEKFLGFQEEQDSKVQSRIAQVLEERVAPVLKKREEERKAKWEAECRTRAEEKRAKALVEFERLRKELGL